MKNIRIFWRHLFVYNITKKKFCISICKKKIKHEFYPLNNNNLNIYSSILKAGDEEEEEEKSN